jgi:hypothetical protein
MIVFVLKRAREGSELTALVILHFPFVDQFTQNYERFA